MMNELESEGRIRVLLVEQNPLDRFLLQGLLSGLKHLVITVLTPTDDIQRFVHPDNYQVVLIDVGDAQGAQLQQILRPIQDVFPHLPIVVLTESVSELQAVEAVELGADDCICLEDVTPRQIDSSIRLTLARVRRHIALPLRIEEVTADKTLLLIGDDSEVDFEQSLLNSLRQQFIHLLVEKRIPGTQPYDLLEEIGFGLQGKVYCAVRHGARGCETLHAVKIFDPKPYRSAKAYWEDMGRIARQISVLQRHLYPHLLHQHDYHEVRGIGFVEMEVLVGLNLQELLDESKIQHLRDEMGEKEWEVFGLAIFREGDDGRLVMQPGAAAFIIDQALTGLRGLHKAGYVHLDLKPANLMINVNGLIKVVDFGRAVRISEKIERLLCSPFYVAPELEVGKIASVDNDIYSLGLVLLFLLNGKHPFEQGESAGEDLIEYLRPQKNDLPNTIEAFLPSDVMENPLFFSLIRSMVTPEVEHRIEDVDSLLVGDRSFAEIRRQLVRTYQDADYEVCFRHLLMRAES